MSDQGQIKPPKEEDIVSQYSKGVGIKKPSTLTDMAVDEGLKQKSWKNN